MRFLFVALVLAACSTPSVVEVPAAPEPAPAVPAPETKVVVVEVAKPAPAEPAHPPGYAKCVSALGDAQEAARVARVMQQTPAGSSGNPPAVATAVAALAACEGVDSGNAATAKRLIAEFK